MPNFGMIIEKFIKGAFSVIGKLIKFVYYKIKMEKVYRDSREGKGGQ